MLLAAAATADAACRSEPHATTIKKQKERPLEKEGRRFSFLLVFSGFLIVSLVFFKFSLVFL